MFLVCVICIGSTDLLILTAWQELHLSINSSTFCSCLGTKSFPSTNSSSFQYSDCPCASSVALSCKTSGIVIRLLFIVICFVLHASIFRVTPIYPTKRNHYGEKDAETEPEDRLCYFKVTFKRWL